MAYIVRGDPSSPVTKPLPFFAARFALALLFTCVALRAAPEALSDTDRELLPRILELFKPADGYRVVRARTGTYRSFTDEDAATQEKFVKYSAKNLEIERCDSTALIKDLIAANDAPRAIDIASDEKAGYIVDDGETFMKYFGEDGGKWEQWKKDDPSARGFLTISLPVIDEKTGTVLVYVGMQTAEKTGSGYLYAYHQRGWQPAPPPIPADADDATRERLQREWEKKREADKRNDRYAGEPADGKLIEVAKVVIWLSL